jgi:hypothetical protein
VPTSAVTEAASKQSMRINEFGLCSGTAMEAFDVRQRRHIRSLEARFRPGGDISPRAAHRGRAGPMPGSCWRRSPTPGTPAHLRAHEIRGHSPKVQFISGRRGLDVSSTAADG